MRAPEPSRHSDAFSVESIRDAAHEIKTLADAVGANLTGGFSEAGMSEARVKGVLTPLILRRYGCVARHDDDDGDLRRKTHRLPRPMRLSAPTNHAKHA